MTFPAWTLSAGVAVLVCGTLLAMLPRGVRRGLLLQAIGVVLTSAAGCSVLAGAAGFGSAFGDGLGPSAGVDPLSGAFLVAIGLAAAPALVFASGYLQGAAHARATAATTGIFALALVGVVVARDAVSFLLMWELMSLAPAATILIASRSREVCRVVLVYLGMTHVAAAGVWLSVLTLAHLHAFSNAHAMSGQSSLVRSLVAGAALVGFGTKAGLMPFHTWLPRAHPVAPGPVSAIMSGVMIKVALYGLVRMLFWWIQPLPHWVAPVLLASAIVSCVGGVLAALLQDELKRVLAFSSIENVGIIALGLAVSLIATSSGHPDVAALAFAAALLHTLNHAAFKSLLFLCAGSFQRQAGKLELNGLGGLLRTMPLTGVAFLVGSLAIAGVPPFNGFVSEWLTFQALIQLALRSSGPGALMGAAGAVALAATAALGVYCFVRVAGLVVLGPHRSRATTHAGEVAFSMTSPVVVLAGICLVLGVWPEKLVTRLASVSPFGKLPEVHRFGLAFPGSGTLAPLAVFALLSVCVGVLQVARRRGGVADPSPVWMCGQQPHARLAWTSVGFTKPLRLVLERVLRARRVVTVEHDGAIVTSVVHETEVPLVFDTLLYRPLLNGAVVVSLFVRRLQSGSLRAYLTYLLVSLAIVLGVVHWTVG